MNPEQLACDVRVAHSALSRVALALTYSSLLKPASKICEFSRTPEERKNGHSQWGGQTGNVGERGHKRATTRHAAPLAIPAAVMHSLPRTEHSSLRRSTRVLVKPVRLEPQGWARASRPRARRGWYSATVIKVRGRGKHLECYVKWAGYSSQHNCWLSRRDVTDKALTAFRKERARERLQPSKRPQEKRARELRLDATAGGSPCGRRT